MVKRDSLFEKTLCSVVIIFGIRYKRIDIISRIQTHSITVVTVVDTINSLFTTPINLLTIYYGHL